MAINIEYLNRCIQTLEMAYSLIQKEKDGTINYEMYRNALVKGFEMSLEQAGKLLRKKLLPYFASKKIVDSLTFKDLFREAFKHSLINEDEAERWMVYRDNRNSTAHDYGSAFAEETLILVDNFLVDVKNLMDVISNE